MKIILNLSKKEILEKEFNTNLKGYDVYEIDHFLDLIIKDYDSFKIMLEKNEIELKNLKEENEELKQKNLKLNNHTQKLRKEIKILEEKGLNNIDILKRINKLEEKK